MILESKRIAESIAMALSLSVQCNPLSDCVIKGETWLQLECVFRRFYCRDFPYCVIGIANA